ncbi:polyphenol oxidase family protein [Sinomonas atrocyanea]|uniref:polyphenol oxidase family protein n=1 Tax=Sinomonas atrocyanea TaxID=37927 RepID=UPI00278B5440|nr:polyphenol oxidase family protein [Sinomonas atrocyanea]MDQ0260053.1 YfiH family protein [Sinomonas atrocyanea]MDR6620074.1 YfiH family protein [Sinomonas atrocyanea]
MSRGAAAAAPAEGPFWWRRDVRPGVTVAFTRAAAGNLAFHVGGDDDGVRRHRAALAAAAGVPSFQYMSQVHGREAVWAGEDPVPTADALLSRGEPLAVMVADCVPVVLVGELADGRPALAAVHAGRPGLVAGVVPEAVARLRDAGARRLEAWLGPSICGTCYEVPAQLRDEVEAAVPGTAATTSWGTPALDLPAGVRDQLARADVAVHRGAEACTYEHDEFFSHRRAPGVGRIAGLVWSHG